MARRLDDVGLAALMLDGIELKARMSIVALGITTEGVKIPLGLRDGSTENATVATALLSDLVERGHSTPSRGSSSLSTAPKHYAKRSGTSSARTRRSSAVIRHHENPRRPGHPPPGLHARIGFPDGTGCSPVHPVWLVRGCRGRLRALRLDDVPASGPGSTGCDARARRRADCLHDHWHGRRRRSCRHRAGRRDLRPRRQRHPPRPRRQRHPQRRKGQRPPLRTRRQPTPSEAAKAPTASTDKQAATP